MSPRELAKVLIRVMGIGFLAYAVLTGSVMILQIASDSSVWRDMRAFVLGSLGVVFVIAIFLIRQADWLAARFRVGAEPVEGAPTASTTGALDAATLSRVGTGLIGVWCLTHLTAPISSIVHEFTQPEPTTSFLDRLRPSHSLGRAAIEIAVTLVLSVVLIVGPARIGRWIRRTFTASRPPADAPPPA